MGLELVENYHYFGKFIDQRSYRKSDGYQELESNNEGWETMDLKGRKRLRLGVLLIVITMVFEKVVRNHLVTEGICFSPTLDFEGPH